MSLLQSYLPIHLKFYIHSCLAQRAGTAANGNIACPDCLDAFWRPAIPEPPESSWETEGGTSSSLRKTPISKQVSGHVRLQRKKNRETFARMNHMRKLLQHLCEWFLKKFKVSLIWDKVSEQQFAVCLTALPIVHNHLLVKKNNTLQTLSCNDTNLKYI